MGDPFPQGYESFRPVAGGTRKGRPAELPGAETDVSLKITQQRRFACQASTLRLMAILSMFHRFQRQANTFLTDRDSGVRILMFLKKIFF
jgi:hypothetical protein